MRQRDAGMEDCPLRAYPPYLSVVSPARSADVA